MIRQIISGAVISLVLGLAIALVLSYVLARASSVFQQGIHIGLVAVAFILYIITKAKRKPGSANQRIAPQRTRHSNSTSATDALIVQASELGPDRAVTVAEPQHALPAEPTAKL